MGLCVWVAEDEVGFWKNEFETDAIMVRTHIETPASRGAERETPSKRPGRKGGGSSSFVEGSQMDGEGNFVANRKGTSLYKDINKGTCTEEVTVQGAPMCAVERSRVQLARGALAIIRRLALREKHAPRNQRTRPTGS